MERLISVYLDVKDNVLKNGFGGEIDWQASLHLADLTEHKFIEEGAWVILSAGMRESLIRVKFPAISRAFGNWTSAKFISDKRASCRRAALKEFGNRRKIDAIISLAMVVAEDGFSAVNLGIKKGENRVIFDAIIGCLLCLLILLILLVPTFS